MRAAWYEKQGAARDVLVVGEMDDPQPHNGEIRIRVAFSGVNPGDVKKREDAFGVGVPYPRGTPSGLCRERKPTSLFWRCKCGWEPKPHHFRRPQALAYPVVKKAACSDLDLCDLSPPVSPRPC
jgi:hypothetical protein